ncbi:exopolysaccharide biosynthesis protein [Roseovarius indicus]|uniref:exopolysaccharide biosynthesis protein n=2 Tax=Roseovarius indicus TaxID=540747 RepID=UPI0007D97C30|nr:exopolysaccharide biosynthesis protein [Roseovarius indicus]OAO00059.1 exopolysaccharide biosynthesis protein exod [Roseovarius indicus]
MTSTAKARPMAAVDIVRATEDALDGERVTVDDVVTHLGKASYTPLLVVPGLLLASPLSGVPGFSAACGVLITAVSAQQIVRRPGLWLPRWLRRASMPSKRVHDGVAGLRKPAGWLDRVTRRRIQWLTYPPFSVLPQGLCLICGVVMPVLEFIPFTSSVLGLVVAVVATGMFMADGLLVILGMMGAAGAVGTIAAAI